MARLSSLLLLALPALVHSQACSLSPAQTFYPGSAGYAQLAPLYNKAVSSTPEWVYAASSAADVSAALCYIVSRGLTFRIRGGGHSFTGESACATPTGCVQIDLSGMKAVTYNAATGVATIGPGARSSDIYAALDGFGRTVVSGTCRPVGFAGLALGGGFGVLSRQFGLALDRVVGFEVVLPSGAVVVADAGTNADLFWALRGGGHANFGVVTSFAVATVDTSKAKFQFRLFSSKTAGAGAPAAAALVAWQAFAAASDRGTFTQVAMGTYQAGEPSFAVMVVHNGSAAAIDARISASGLLSYVSPVPCGPGLANPVNPGGPAVTYSCSDMPYSNVHELIGYCGLESDLAFQSASLYQNESAPISLAGAQAIWDAYASIHSRFGCVAEWSDLMIDAFGGAVADVDAAATAFPHRRAFSDLQFNTIWRAYGTGAGDAGAPPGCIAWLHNLYATASGVLGTTTAYSNYPTLDLGAKYGTDYWAGNYPRLQTLKRQLDPSNIFSYPQSVQPAGTTGASATPAPPASGSSTAAPVSPTRTAPAASPPPSPSSPPAPSASSMPGALPISTDSQCGPAPVAARCPGSSCCSKFGWCGITPAHCDAGCQVGYGACSGSAPTATASPAVAASASASAPPAPSGSASVSPSKTTTSTLTAAPSLAPTSSAQATKPASAAASASSTLTAAPSRSAAPPPASASSSPVPSAAPPPTLTAAATRSLALSSPSSSLAPAPSSLPVSTDSQCGPAPVGARCPGTSCCSKFGWCGITPAYCDAGCQVGYGACSGSAPTATASPAVAASASAPPAASAPAPPQSPSRSVAASAPAPSRSPAPSSAASASLPPPPSPSASRSLAPPAPSASSTPGAALPVSTDGACGSVFGVRCGGSGCCSKFGWCGVTSAYCDAGCQVGYGACSGGVANAAADSAATAGSGVGAATAPSSGASPASSSAPQVAVVAAIGGAVAFAAVAAAVVAVVMQRRRKRGARTARTAAALGVRPLESSDTGCDSVAPPRGPGAAAAAAGSAAAPGVCETTAAQGYDLEG